MKVSGCKLQAKNKDTRYVLTYSIQRLAYRSKLQVQNTRCKNSLPVHQSASRSVKD